MTPREKLLKDLAAVKYKTLLEEKGPIFEDKKVALSAQEIRQIKLRLVAFFTIGLVAIPAFCLWIFLTESSSEYKIEAGFLLFSGVLFGIWMTRSHLQMLKRGEKSIYKGVILDKIIEDEEKDEYDFNLSNQVTIRVGSGDFNKYQFGDIIEADCMVSDDYKPAKKITLIGRLPE